MQNLFKRLFKRDKKGKRGHFRKVAVLGSPEQNLANAMNRLANRIEEAQDPLRWQKLFHNAMSTLVNIPSMAGTLQQAVPGLNVEALTVSLTDAERTKLSNRIYRELKPQLDEFQSFTRQALKEMPPHRLQEIAGKLAAGAKPVLKKRRDCVFLAVGKMPNDEYYLGL